MLTTRREQAAGLLTNDHPTADRIVLHAVSVETRGDEEMRQDWLALLQVAKLEAALDDTVQVVRKLMNWRRGTMQQSVIIRAVLSVLALAVPRGGASHSATRNSAV